MQANAPVRTRKSDEEILASLPVELAKEVKELSEVSGTSVKNLLATLIWIGRKAFGRRVVISSAEEKKSLRLEALSDFDKIESLDKK